MSVFFGTIDVSHCSFYTASSVMHLQMFIRAAILVTLVALAASLDCSYDDQEGYIIDIHNSEKNGAIFMSDVNTVTRESCQNACCDAEEVTLEDGSIAWCNLAVYHDKSRDRKSKNCFLVFCPSENSCRLTKVKGFTSSYVTETMVEETTDPEAFANRPPNPKFYRPDLPINFHKLFRRSNSDKKTETDAGDAAKQTKMVLESAKKLLDVKVMPAVDGEDKQMAAEEENILSEIAQGALQSMEKRAKGSKNDIPYLTTPVVYVETTSKQPQKTARPTTSKVKITTQRPTAKKTSTRISQTESPTQKTTSMKLTEGTRTSTQPSTKKQETIKPIISSHRPTTAAATNPSTSPLLAKLTTSGNKTPLVITSTPSGTPRPTSLSQPQGTSQHPVTLTASTKGPSPGTSSAKALTSPSSLATAPSTKPPSGSTAAHSTSSTTTKSLGTLATSSSPPSNVHSVTTEPSSTQETTRSSTLLPENESTLSPSTKQSTPIPDSTSPFKTTPSIPASISMDNQSSSSILFNETNISDDLATDVDSEDGQDSSEYSVNASNGALIAAVCFGVIFLLAVMVVLGKHWYEAYQRRHYSKVDYLINGMYN
ncbi:MANSC domain-containing protein 1-like isoform X1 [Patiria miniata]|uniref:MANSC domain-containing protein n=1 Tax=Patiria miniata TaxID=46514 RepID=A0A913ZBU5_PATMI|nr:MANSC domain-containing protein 1-like isoform X1 [Patiria miniata]